MTTKRSIGGLRKRLFRGHSKMNVIMAPSSHNSQRGRRLLKKTHKKRRKIDDLTATSLRERSLYVTWEGHLENTQWGQKCKYLFTQEEDPGK